MSRWWLFRHGKRGRRLAVVLFAWLGAETGTAAPALDLTAMSLEELLAQRIISTPKFEGRAADLPAAISILTAEDIRRFGWRTLADGLRTLQGFNITYDRTYNYAGVRGISVPGDFRPRLQVLIDGLSTTDNIYDGALIGTDFPLDLDLVERIEVVRGPSASVFGGDSMTGVVNVVTRRDPGNDGVEIAVVAGSGRARQARVTAAGRADSGVSILLSATDGTATGRRNDFPEFAAAGYDPAASSNDGDRSRKFFARVRLDDWQATLIHGQREKQVPSGSYGTVFNDPAHREDDGLWLAEVANTRPLGDSGQLRSRVLFGRYGYRGDFPYDTAVPYVINRDTVVGSWWGMESRALIRVAEDHRLAAGIEYFASLRQYQRNEDLGYGCFANSTLPCLDDNRREHRFAVFAQDEITLAPGLLATVGARVDHVLQRNYWSPRLGLVRHFAGGDTLKALAATAFRTPTVYERYYSPTGFPYGNPDLKRERLRSIEGIWERDWGARTRTTASLFTMRAVDMIASSMVGDAVNATPLRANGLELEIDHRWVGGASLRAGVTGQRSIREGQRPDNVPARMAKFNLALPLPGSAWTAGLEAQAIGARRTAAGAATIPAHVVTNVNFTGPLPIRDWTLSAGIYNLLDRRYEDPVGVDTLMAVARNSVIQDRRAFRLKLQGRF